MTKRELYEIECEVDQIDAEMDWRDPNIEYRWFEWADARLAQLIETLEESSDNKPRRYLKLVS